MNTIALIGAQWGDEGKGKYIDILASSADYVVRATGGSNAGHTVVRGDKAYKLHLIPSGILYPDTVNIIGNGVVLDPQMVLAEMDELAAMGVKFDNLLIDLRAHIVLPYHKEFDELAEIAKGVNAIGTTKRGIGPCYADKCDRIGIRLVDLLDENTFAQKLKQNLQLKNKIITAVYGGKPLDYDEIYTEYCGYAKRLQPFARDTGALLYDAVKADKRVVFEGAQGTLLDLDSGTYPFVTSSHPITGGFCAGAGVGPTAIKECLGIAKSYTTRVGAGPFPTELDDEVGNHLRDVGHEYGVTTGRARRCGWLDTVILRLAVRINGLTALAINKLDPLTGLKTIKVAVGYELNGKILKDFPADISILERCTPIYEEFEGWTEDITACRRFEDLPKAAQRYVLAIEKLVDCPVTMIGVGPDKEQNIVR
ncbi:MAG: adenylosuccinate synthase [Clostridiales bacterium]|nr:adenylosuccinate synthase [Clostridiales bacterium]